MRQLMLCTMLLLMALWPGPIEGAITENQTAPDLELEAERLFFGPNFQMQDSFLIEGRVIEAGSDYLEIKQHLDSPPQPVEPKINMHPATLIQIRTVDSQGKIKDIENKRWDMIKAKELKNQVILILYLPHSETAKSIMIIEEI
ncbi:MAG: hypothetical protein FH749_12175 [Firmicutes bacterium]|nr:hypothetical protein [Bacillota bacterium]